MREVSDNLVERDKSLNDTSDGESECGIQQNKNKMLKRKSSEVYGSVKKYHAVNSDILDITNCGGVTEIQEIGPASRESTEESSVKCPICGGELTLRIFILVFIYKLLTGQAVVSFLFVKG
jgi:hypothetical protein